MRLSWNEIRARAAHFTDEWKDARYEKGETHTFYNEFFEVFGVTRRRVATFEEPVRKLDGKHGFIDLFWKGVLLVEQKSAGGNLTKAKEQAFDYFPGIKESDLPRHVLVSDFQTFELYDLDGEHQTVKFGLEDLPKNVEHFGFVLGVEKRTFRDQDPVNIRASELMGKLHDSLKEAGYTGHDLERFLVRLLFCLFADDTGIFEPRDIFIELIEARTREDGSDVGPWLSQLFEVLDTPVESRQTNLDEDLQRFPYVNGDLFHERLKIPAFNASMRRRLIEACEFSWDAISPAIFGSLFQSVMSASQRRSSGGHYTTEKNIMKVIQPLFLDDLRAEFDRLRARRDTGRRTGLLAFHKKLGELRFFDPACGCGNFLVIAYRELRELEIDLLKELHAGQQTFFDVSTLSNLNVNQFYGIEIFEFPARIAEVALWMMDHIMNNKLSLAFGDYYARIPLKVSPHIHNVDALEVEWSSVLSPTQCSYLFGNPPFVGAKLQSALQREQVRRIADLGASGGTLDYVAAWFIKGGEYVQTGSARIGFVATNSVTQGEQVAQLWPVLFQRCGLEINFAHRTFAWGSDARGRAHVHVVILGLIRRDAEPKDKRLFSYDDVNGDPVESRHTALSPYLFDAGALNDRHLVVREISAPLCEVPRMVIGSKPIDGGHYIFGPAERQAFLTVEPTASKYMHPFVGSEEYINGGQRWILSLDGISPADLRRMPAVAARVASVKKMRLASKSKPTRDLADMPIRFHVTVIPDRPFLCIPKVSSERREYVPIGWLEPPTIPSDLVFVLRDANLYHFGILTSQMHMAWLRYIGGRLESRYRYSIGIVYNNFPWPEVSAAQQGRIRQLAQGVLDARVKFPTATLADLYDADAMHPELRKAHRDLDAAVNRLYRGSPFLGDRERVEHLFARYEKLVLPLLPQTKPRRARAVIPARRRTGNRSEARP